MLARVFAAVAAVLLLAGPLSRPSQAEPALWVARDADSTLYLFGTVHVLKPDTKWRSPALEQAMRGSDEVWFEVDPAAASDPAALGALMSLMVDPDRPLSRRLDPALYRRFQDAVRGIGMDPAQLDSFKPAMAGVVLATEAMTQAGYDPDSGVDKVLRDGLAAKPVRELETLRQQIGFMANLSDPVQVALLDSALDDMETLGQLDGIVTAWANGDVAALDRLLVQEMRADHPEAYQVFIVDRNKAWTDVLARELQGSGTDFVAVGALHLVGSDGLPTMLAARGFTVERLQ